MAHDNVSGFCRMASHAGSLVQFERVLKLTGQLKEVFASEPLSQAQLIGSKNGHAPWLNVIYLQQQKRSLQNLCEIKRPPQN
jgi:hypothetical protein